MSPDVESGTEVVGVVRDSHGVSGASAGTETAPNSGASSGPAELDSAFRTVPGGAAFRREAESRDGRSPDVRQPFWSRPGMVAAAGETLRPGSFTLTDRAARLAGLAPGWRVLDVGSGLGATVRRLRARHGALAVGIERNGRQLRRMTGGPAPFVCGGMEAMPFADGRFDMVFCECVLSLLERPGDGLAEVRRVLRPGGVLALSDLYLSEGRREARPDGAGVSCATGAMSREEIRGQLKTAGFRITHFEDHSRLLTELAARLILAGEGGASCGSGCAPRGYYLLLADRIN